MIHSSCSSNPEIRRCSAILNLDRHLWRSRITKKTKLHLYRVFILMIMLYGSECWAISKADWRSGPMVPTNNPGHSLAWLVRNADIHRITNQPSLSSIKSYFLWASCTNGWERRCLPSHLRTSSRELDATTGAAGHNLDEEHSWCPVFAGSWDTWG